MKKAKIIWGFYLIIISIFILLNELNTFQDIPFLKLLVPLIMLPMFVDGLIKRGFLRMLLPVTVTALIFAPELGILHISPWVLLLATIMLGVGLDLLFPKKKKIVFQTNNANIGTDMNRLVIESKSGSVVKYIDSDNFTSADINASCSGIKLYFDKAVINPHGAVINLDITCSKLELYIPRTWQVTDGIDNMLSTFSVVGNGKNNSDDIIVSLQGKAKFANIKVIYM